MWLLEEAWGHPSKQSCRHLLQPQHQAHAKPSPISSSLRRHLSSSQMGKLRHTFKVKPLFWRPATGKRQNQNSDPCRLATMFAVPHWFLPLPFWNGGWGDPRRSGEPVWAGSQGLHPLPSERLYFGLSHGSFYFFIRKKSRV